MARTIGALNVRTLDVVADLEVAAEAQRWLIPSSTARACGLSSATLRSLRAIGRWRAVVPGVDAVMGADGGPFQQLHAELLVAGAGAFAQGLTAAALHESVNRPGAAGRPAALDLPWDGTVDIAVPRGGSGRGRRRRVPEQHLTTVAGLRCPDGLLTVLDLAALVDARAWEQALEAALRHRLTTVTEIEAALAAPRRRDRAAVGVVRAVLEVRPPGAPPTGSLLETFFVQLARDHGLPLPERQHCITISPTKRYFVDLAWPALRFFVELDGRDHERHRLHDADRLAAIVEATGWTYIILTWHQVVRTPTRTAARVAQILASRAAA